MIDSVRFENFKVLNDATLKLGPLNVVVGPNGSGKTTALNAIEQICSRSNAMSDSIRTVGSEGDGRVLAALTWSSGGQQLEAGIKSEGNTPTTPLASVDANARKIAKPYFSRNGSN